MNGEGTHAVPNYPNPVLSNVNMHPMPGDRPQPINTDAYTAATQLNEPITVESPSGEQTVTQPAAELTQTVETPKATTKKKGGSSSPE